MLADFTLFMGPIHVLRMLR